jgi:hypothetical protein
MTPEQAKALLEPMEPNTKLAVARAVRESASDAAGCRPTEGFIADVFDEADRMIRGQSHCWQMVLDAYLEVVLADAVTPDELLAEHRRVVDAYTESDQ